MATAIIVTNTPTIGGDLNIDFLFWLYPPTANQQYYKAPNTVSQFVRASAQDNTDLQNGVKVEESHSFLVPTGFTVAQIEATLVALYNQRNTQFQNQQSQWSHEGVSWDSATQTWGQL